MMGIAYQGGGIGAIDTEDGDGGLDVAGGRSREGSGGSGSEGEGSLGGSSPNRAED